VQDATRTALLALYDTLDPASGRPIPGYDRDHAERTTRLVMRLARDLGVEDAYRADLEVACLLHDLGRAGMDPRLFGRIFAVAQEVGLPVRLREFLAAYPQVVEARATEHYLSLLRPALESRAIPVDQRVVEHVRMRMDFKARLRETLAQKAPELRSLGVTVRPWMEKVMHYYYYPREIEGQPSQVRLMAMALVACENFEAYNNRQRGRDYYGREQERLSDVFAALDRFRDEGLVSAEVLDALPEADVEFQRTRV